jgi:hypothetical protein
MFGIVAHLSSTLRIFARVLDAGPEDCRFRNNARGLFDAGCRASEGAEWNPSFLRKRCSVPILQRSI